MEFKNLIFRILFNFTLKIRKEDFNKILDYYNKTQYQSFNQLQSIQIEKLNSLIDHARRNVPYYRDILPREIRSLDELDTIPFLEKENLRSKHYSLFTKYGHLQRTKTSGGSTGAPVSVLKNSEGVAQEMAASWRGYNWAGINVGDRQARFWGVPKNRKERVRSKVIDFICHRIRVTAFGYDTNTLKLSIKRLNRFKPDYLYGYTSIIEEFASYIKENNLELGFNLKAIITTSEVLAAPTRSAIEDAFECKVFDEYGCGEVGTIAHECEYGSLHLNMENSIVEIVGGDNSKVPDGSPGEIIVTDLTNYSMPLIRYRIKDFGVISTEPCQCGRNLQVLEKVFGRQYDALINSEGKKFHGEFFLYIAEDAKKLEFKFSGVQFTQDSRDSILVCLAAEHRDKKLEQFISSRIKEDFDASFKIQFKWQKAIKREPSGKLRVVKYDVE